MPNDVINTITIGSTTYDIGGTGGGHVIEKSDGTDMTQRANLQFVDATLTDDSTNDRTVVENVHVIDDEDELDDLPDGIYIGDYDDTTPIDASVIAYDNTTSGLTADDVQDAIDELVDETDRMDTTTTSASGNPISIAGLKSDQLAVNPIITFEPIQAGSGIPSPDNIMAISGYDKIDISSVGAKVWDGILSNGHIDLNGAYVSDNSNAVSDYILVTPDTYSIISDTFKTFNAWYVWTYDANKIYINQAKSASHTTGTGLNSTFTLTGNTRYIRIQFNATGQISANTDSKIYVGLSTATQDNDYVIATSISESLGQTVYHATHNIRDGKMDVDSADYVFTGDETWTSAWGGIAYSCTCLTSKPAVADATKKNVYECEIAEPKTVNQIYMEQVGIAANGNNIYISSSLYASISSFTGKKLVYELATPFTIQLTPRELTLLKTYAYVSTNGNNIQLSYHNGEMASLGDVAKLNETIEELSRPPIRIFEEEIVSYTSTNNKYQIPCDGYIEALVPHGSGYVRVQVYDSAGSTLIRILRNADAETDEYFGTYVKKGMQARVTVSGLSDVSVKFRAMA